MNVILCIGMIAINILVQKYFIGEYYIYPAKSANISVPICLLYGLLCYGIRGTARKIIKYKKDRRNGKKVSFVNKDISFKGILKFFGWVLLIFILIIDLYLVLKHYRLIN